jgi:heat-inducible transcriptional repressor
MHELLTERQARLLNLVVREHIASGQPVSSLVLLRRHDVGAGGATIRNELAALTEMGFLRQPHTSAGRVPTIEGYRYFVEHLVHSSGLSEAEKASIRLQFHRAGRDPERWMRLSATLMAQTSGAAAIVATPRRAAAGLRHLDLVALDDGLVQVVAIMADGSVRQWRWRPEHAVDQLVLDRLGDEVNRRVRPGTGLSLPSEVSQHPLELAGLDLVRELLPELSQPTEPRLYHAGLAHVLDEPALAGDESLHHLLELVAYGHGLDRLFDVQSGGEVEVLLGGDPPLERAPQVSFVIATFGAPGTQTGVVGVVGPRRLAYERAVPAVRYVSGILTRLFAGEAV